MTSVARPAPFSDAELERRHAIVDEIARRHDCDRTIGYGADRSGSAVPWLTRWPVTREAVVVLEPGEPDTLIVQFHNHVRLAGELAIDAEVRWGGQSTIDTLIDHLRRRGGGRIGMIGTIPYQLRDALAAAFGPPVDLTPEYIAARLTKSDEELAHLQYGAALSDAAMSALADGLAAGRTDHELIDRIERAYVPHGGSTHIHYLAITSMDRPDRPVPAQQPLGATVERGSVVVAELSAAFRGYPGQVLRTMTFGGPPTPLYRELHEVAQRTFDAIMGVLRDGTTPAEVVEAARIITDVGFRLCDDLVHGFGGGYLPPVIGRLDDPLPDVAFREGMTVVVQPNVMTCDETAGVQTGELVLVTRHGARTLHSSRPGLWELGVG